MNPGPGHAHCCDSSISQQASTNTSRCPHHTGGPRGRKSGRNRRVCTDHGCRPPETSQRDSPPLRTLAETQPQRLLEAAWKAWKDSRTYLRKFSRSSRLQEDQERSLGFRPFTHSPDMMWDRPAQDEWSSSWFIPKLPGGRGEQRATLRLQAAELRS